MKTNYTTLSDKSLAELLSNSDDGAFKEIYNRYWPILYQHAFRLLNHNARAEDLVQNIFVKIYSNMSRFDKEIPVEAYLRKAVRNGVIDLSTKDSNMRKYKRYYERYNQEGHCTIDDEIREKELKQLIEREIEALPPRMRAVYELSRKAHLSHKEIAAALSVSEGTVKKQLYNALKKLRAKLNSHFFLLIMHTILVLHKLMR